jgi:hypothetical protein
VRMLRARPRDGDGVQGEEFDDGGVEAHGIVK